MWRGAALWACVVLLVSVSLVNAATYNVPCCSTSDIALNLASATSAGDVIQLAAGTYAGACGFNIGVSGLTLRGVSRSGTTLACTGYKAYGFRFLSGSFSVSDMTMFGDAAFSSFGLRMDAYQVGPVALTNVMFTNWGTAVYIGNEGTLNVTNCYFYKNNVTELIPAAAAPAIVALTTTLTVTDTVFENNSAICFNGLVANCAESGAVGVYLAKDSPSTTSYSSDAFALTTFLRCNFTNNIFTGTGSIKGAGALISLSEYPHTWLVIRSTVFVNNLNTLFGAGAADLRYGFAIYDSEFTNNKGTKQSPGALNADFLYSQTVLIQNTTFTANTGATTQSAGAIRLLPFNTITDYYIINCTFLNNMNRQGAGSALLLGCGGDCSATSHHMTYIQGCTFVGNRAPDAVISVVAGIYLNITNTVFRGNNASGIAVKSPLFALAANTGVMADSTTFADNFGGVTSAGMYVPTGATVNITRSIFSGSFSANVWYVTGGSFYAADTTCTGTIYIPNAGGGCLYVENNPSVFIQRVRFANLVVSGPAIVGGGALYATASASTTVADSTFTNIRLLSGNGGAWYIQSSQPLYTSGNVFTNVTAANGDGGAIYIASTINTVAISNSNFVNCSASLGGAVRVVKNSLSYAVSISSSTFSGNNATKGAGIYSEGVISVASSSFSRNNAVSTGGGIYTDLYAKSTVTGSSMTNNIAANGGAIHAAIQSYVTLSDTNFTANTARENGGAINADYAVASLTLTRGIFSANSARTSGGAMFTSPGGAVCSMTSSLFTNNRASVNGGAIYGQTDCTMSSTQLSSNSATGSGGAMYLDTAAYDMTQVTVSQNRAVNGGGLFLTSNPAMIILNSNIASNTASGSGGGIGCSIGWVVARGTTFANNKGSGAAFTCDSQSVFDIDPTSVFTNNVDSDSTSAVQAQCSACGCCSGVPSPAIMGGQCFPYPGRNCSYTCSSGFYASTTSMRCEDTATYSPSTLCPPATCNALTTGLPLHVSVVSQPATSRTGETINLQCDAGYQLVGNASALCFAPGWVYTTRCDPTPCVEIAEPDHGNSSAPSASTEGSIRFECFPGYKLVGNSSITCFGTIFGYNSSAPTCQAVYCPILTAPASGNVTLSSANPFLGDTATYSCASGHTLTGGSSRRCVGAPGGTEWTGTAPTCPLAKCDPLDPPLNGNYNGSGQVLSSGDLIVFTCNFGFVLHGDPQITCVAPGYSSPVPSCQAVACAAYGAPYVSPCGTGDLAYQQTCETHCAAGYYGVTTQYQCVQSTQNLPARLMPAKTNCTICPVASYAAEGDLACTPCVQGTTSTDGASKQADCLCFEGFFEEASNPGYCNPCPAGGYCAGGHAAPQAKAGFFPILDGKGQLTFTACSPASACVGNGLCAEGYQGIQCGECQEGYFPLTNECYKCPDDGAWRLYVGGTAVFIVALIVMASNYPTHVEQRTYGLASVLIYLSFVQLTAAFGDLGVPWPPASRRVFNLMSSLNLNVEVLHPDCTARATYFQKLQAQMVASLVFFILLLLLWIFGMIISYVRMGLPNWRVFRHTFHAIKRTAIGGSMFIMVILYLFLSRSALAPFACEESVDGTWHLVWFRTYLCYTADWYRNIAAAVFGLIFYVVGIPALLVVVYIFQRRRYGAAMTAESAYCNFYAGKYTNAYWFWDITIMIRKLLIVIISFFFTQDASAQVVLCCVVVFVATLMTLIFSPYRWSRHNTSESLTLIGSIVILFCGQLTTSNTFGEAQNTVTDVIVVLTVIVVTLGVLACVLYEIGLIVHVMRVARRILHSPSRSRACDGEDVMVIPCNGNVATLTPDGEVRMWLGGLLQKGRAAVGQHVASASNLNPYTVLGGGKSVAIWELGPLALQNSDALESVPFAVDNIGATVHNGVAAVEETATKALGCLWREDNLPSPVTSVDMSTTHIAAGTADGKVYIWKINGGSMVTSRSRVKLNDVNVFGASGASVFVNTAFDDAELSESTPSARTSARNPLEESLPEVKEGKVPAPDEELRVSGRFTLEGHSGPVTEVRLETGFCYSASTDNTVRKWSIKKHIALRTWHINETESLSQLAVEGALVIVSVGRRCHIIDQKTNRSRVIVCHRRPITGISCVNHRLFTASYDGTIKVWTLPGGEYLQAIETGSHEPVTSLTVMPDTRVYWTQGDGHVGEGLYQEEWDMGHVALHPQGDWFDSCKGTNGRPSSADQYNGVSLTSFVTAPDGTQVGANDELEGIMEDPTWWQQLEDQDASVVIATIAGGRHVTTQ